MTLLGHDDAWGEWLAAQHSTRMHHAWLLTGPKGLGKGLFARRAAAQLVAEEGIPQPAADMHPDIIVPEHPPENKDESKKRDDGQEFRRKRSIPIDEIRALQHRLTTRPTLGSRRVVIIDPADDLEKNAANALLKSLEEPPQGTFFLLVGHSAGRLLPTIRSRCRMLRFAPLSDDKIEDVLRVNVPASDVPTRAAAIAAAKGSPGAALQFVAQDLGKLHQLMTRLMTEGDDQFGLSGEFSQELGSRPDRERVQAAFDLASALIAANLGRDRRRDAKAISAHAGLIRLAAEAATYNYDPTLLAMEIAGLLASLAVPRETV